MESAATPAAGPVALSTLGQIGITVTDLDRATTFYRDTLRIQFLFQVPNLAFFDCGGVRLMLSLAEKSGEQFSSILYFKVPDIQAAYQAIRGRGAVFEGEPHLVAPMPTYDLWMAFFRDPDRNLLALMSEVSR